MRAVIQRVNEASVNINKQEIREIGEGLLVLLGIHPDDQEEDIQWIIKKIVQLRIFNDEKGVMNKSILDIGGQLLLVSQFTLYASTKKGNRPSYINAARPDVAIPIYERFIEQISHSLDNSIKTGKFGADMQVSLINDGPVTIIIDSKKKE